MKILRTNTPRRSGFTLIEIMVVISMITVLSGIVYTLGKSMITNAQIAESTANLRSLAIANTVYASDYGVFCPAFNRANTLRWHGSRSSTNGKFDPTKGFLSPYLGKSMRVTTCPLFKYYVKGSESFEDGTGGYGYNAAYIGGKPGWNYDSNKIVIPENPLHIPDPARTVMFTTTAFAI
ncbi:MAG: type II secretion system protein, partial [Gloeobacteraceae cyanobacterium ES-bin-144]|nr:type II secretion system protein [Verrucomicrobiales bacterium]